jgi:hypothetical protein
MDGRLRACEQITSNILKVHCFSLVASASSEGVANAIAEAANIESGAEGEDGIANFHHGLL